MLSFDIKECHNPYMIPPGFRSCGVCKKDISIDAPSFWEVRSTYLTWYEEERSKSSLHTCSPECANMAIFMCL